MKKIALLIGILFFFSLIYGEEEIVEKQEVYLSGQVLIPGLYQICQEKQLVKGFLLMGGEIVCLTTGIMAYSNSEKLFKKYNDLKQGNSAEWDKKYNDYKSSYKTMQMLFIGAGAFYAINFIDALIHFKKTVACNQNLQNKIVFNYNLQKIKVGYKQEF
ncbi:MAG: hypothetical protein ABIB46_06405 [bacterium]